MLAETVSLDGGALAVALVLVLLALAVFVAVVVEGFVLAPRAARGERSALAGWIAALVLEGLLWSASIPALLQGAVSLFALVIPALVAAQVAVFLSARRRA